MGSEQRKEARSVVTQQPNGKLHVLHGNEIIEVYKVKDVSQTGIRVKVAKQVEINQKILVRYQTKMIDLKLNGTVVWNSGSASVSVDTEDPAAYLIGIKLNSPSLLETLW